MRTSLSVLVKRVTLCLVLAMALSSPALAKHGQEKSYDDRGRQKYEDRGDYKDDDNDHRGKSYRSRDVRWNDQDQSRKQEHERNRLVLMKRFDGSHRSDIRDYLKDDYTRRCPPGLAKKHHGCVPPGRFNEKHYVVGQIIGYDYAPVPAMLARRLGPPPAGTFYAQVDSDVLLISEATKKVLDAVTLLSAVQ
jgi:Ni/Co efflux regulator RcnB